MKTNVKVHSHLKSSKVEKPIELQYLFYLGSVSLYLASSCTYSGTVEDLLFSDPINKINCHL